MGYLTLLGPVAQVVACIAALGTGADAAIAAGDPRTRSQLMADLLVERVTGATAIDAHDGTGPRPVVPVQVGLVMPADMLLGGGEETAHLAGHGPIPADLARQLVADHLDSGTKLWLRRLYAHPVTGELVAMDSRQRLFRGQLREFLDLRDQWCRTPWCGAPIRHRDHITGAAQGGRTTAADGQGLCEACNYAKTAPGWQARPSPDPHDAGTGGHTVVITTPTGHSYTSHAPPQTALRAGAYQQIAEGRWMLIA